MKPLFLAPTALAVCLALSPAFAQSESEAEAAGTARATFSLDFPGGTLAEYGAAIQKAAGWANIVMDPKASEVRLPKCELRQVSALSALQAAGEMVEQIDPSVGIVVNVIHHSGGAAINTVSVNLARPRKPEAPESKTDRYNVLSLREIVSPPNGAAGLKAEVVLTAVDAAVGLMGDGPRATVKYHSDSGLLLVLGTVEQVYVVEQVVDQIRNDVRSRPAAALAKPAAGSGEKKAASLDERIADLERELARLKEERREKSDGAK